VFSPQPLVPTPLCLHPDSSGLGNGIFTEKLALKQALLHNPGGVEYQLLYLNSNLPAPIFSILFSGKALSFTLDLRVNHLRIMLFKN